MTKKHPAAVALGRLGGRVGGKSKSKAKLDALARHRNLNGRPKGAKDKQPRKARKKAR